MKRPRTGYESLAAKRKRERTKQLRQELAQRCMPLLRRPDGTLNPALIPRGRNLGTKETQPLAMTNRHDG